MATDFSRTLSLLRQEKGISQRKAAGELGISQALLSHYENGIREPGLPFVVKACDYYRVSADYLLGRTLSRDGAMIDAGELYDASEEKGSLKGSILATLQKKLVVNTAGMLFDLLGKTGSREAVSAAGEHLNAALYRLLRELHCRAGGSEGYFSTARAEMEAGLATAQLELSRARYVRALEQHRQDGGSFPPLDAEALSAAYPGLSQSAAQVLHSVDENCRALAERQ